MKPRDLLLTLILVAFALLSACGPIGGDAEPGVSACPALEGQSSWVAPADRVVVADSGEAVSSVDVLAALAANMTTRGGIFTLNLELQDGEGRLLYDGLTTQSFTIDPNTPLVLRQGEGARVDTDVINPMTVSVDVKRPIASGLTGLLVFDSSGSTNGTDPDRLRVSGGHLFTDAVLDGAQLAVMDFGVSEGAFEGSIVSGCLEESRLLNDFTDDKSMIKASIDRVTSAGGTPMYGAIEDGLALAEAVHKRGAERPFLIIFTDGEASDHSEERMNAVISRAKAIEAELHTVALLRPSRTNDDEVDEDADVDIENLQYLSSETGGLSLTANDASDLPAYFNALAGASNSGVSIRVNFSADFSPEVSKGLYTLEGAFNTTVNGGNVNTPFKVLVDLRKDLL